MGPGLTSIATKLHDLAACNIGDTSISACTHPIIARMLAAPDYVVSDEVLELMKREDVHASLMALYEAELARLPFSSMVVEYRPSPIFHEIILLEETADPHVIDTTWSAIRLTDGQGVVSDATIPFRIAKDGLFAQKWPDKKEHEALVVGGGLAISFALLLLNTKGIDKRVIEVPKLNKHRVQRGKIAIPRHTVLHIGTIYRRDGTGESFGSGRHVRMHLRAGHTRRQHFGHENSEVKIVYIPPVVVNFKPDEELVQPRKIIKV